MIETSTTVDRESISKDPSIWNYFIGVSISIVLIITIAQLVFHLVQERSEFVDTEKVANETYNNYFDRLDSISKKYEKEFKSLNKKR